MRLVTSAAMRALEDASERAGVPRDQLLEQAGLAIARSAQLLMGGARGRTVAALVGKGNNGADALVACGHLARSRRWRVRLCLSQSRAGDPHLAWADDPDLVGLVEVMAGDDSETLPRRLADWRGSSDVVPVHPVRHAVRSAPSSRFAISSGHNRDSSVSRLMSHRELMPIRVAQIRLHSRRRTPSPPGLSRWARSLAMVLRNQAVSWNSISGSRASSARSWVARFLMMVERGGRCPPTLRTCFPRGRTGHTRGHSVGCLSWEVREGIQAHQFWLRLERLRPGVAS